MRFGYLLSFVAGLIVAFLVVWLSMPSQMIVVSNSRYDFDTTISKLEESLVSQGWASPGTMDMNAALSKKGVELPFRVKIVKLCQPEYAKSVLMSDPELSSMMPCSIAVYEKGDEVKVAKLNTGLMGKMFGGNVAEVMGNKVAADEKQILSAVLQ